jgi:hypothetical protein
MPQIKLHKTKPLAVKIPAHKASTDEADRLRSIADRLNASNNNGVYTFPPLGNRDWLEVYSLMGILHG